MVKTVKIIKLGAIIVCLGAGLGVPGCAFVPQTYKVVIPDKAERANILFVFDEDRQLIIQAIERNKVLPMPLFEAAKLVNDYIDTHKNPTTSGFRIYLMNYLTKTYNWGGGGWGNRLWKDIMLNYSLLRKIGGEK